MEQLIILILFFNIEDVIKDHYVLVGIVLILIIVIIYTKIKDSKLFSKQNKISFSQEKQIQDTVEKLTKSENLLNEAQRIAKIAYLEKNFITGETIYSDNIWNIFEVLLNEKDNYLEYFKDLEFIHPDDRQYYYAWVEKIRKEKIENYTLKYRAITTKGNVVNIDSTGKIEFNSKGELEKLLIIIQDVTERKKIEGDIITLERKFTDVFNYSPLILSITTLDEGVFLDINEQFLNVFNFTKEEVLGKSVKDLNLYYDLKDEKRLLNY